MRKNKTIVQTFRFAIIGSMAAATHFLSLIFLVKFFDSSPLVANIFAFCIAFSVSYFGHRSWTFSNPERDPFVLISSGKNQKTIKKFFAVAISGFLINESLYALFLNYFHFQYIFALCLVLFIVPPLTFLLSKFWVFEA